MAGTCRIMYLRITLIVFAGGKNHIDTIQMRCRENFLAVDQTVRVRQFLEGLAQSLRRYRRDPGASAQHQAGLARSCVTAANDQPVAPAQVHENR